MVLSAQSSRFPLLYEPSKEGVFLLLLGEDENRITLEFISTFQTHLDRIENCKGPKACIVAGKGKFFSNGLSMECLMNDTKSILTSFHGRKAERVIRIYFELIRICSDMDYRFLKRLLSFPVPLIAAVNGHAFAGGAMLAWACDYRIMNASRGYLCVNEIHIGMPLTPRKACFHMVNIETKYQNDDAEAMCAIIRSKVDRSLWISTMLMGKRWRGQEAAAARMIDKTAKDEKQVMEYARELAASVAPTGENKVIYGAIKREIFRVELEQLDKDEGSIPILQQSETAAGTSKL